MLREQMMRTTLATICVDQQPFSYTEKLKKSILLPDCFLSCPQELYLHIFASLSVPEWTLLLEIASGSQ